MAQDDRQAWLADLGKQMGLTLEFDGAGVCQLILDHELILTIHKLDQSDKLVLFGQIHTPPLPLELAKQMLKRNRSHAKLSAPVISLAPEEDAIEVHLILEPAQLEQGVQWIETLIAELEYWREVTLNDFKAESTDKIDLNISFV